MKFQWIQQHRQLAPIGAMCRLLDVSRSGYHAFVQRSSPARPISDRQRRRQAILDAIKAIHQDSRQTYGSPRMHAELIARGHQCCLNTVARYMRELGLCATPPRGFKPMTTDSNHTHPIAPNTLDRHFRRDEPNQGWVTDITYVPTDEGWLFLAVVIDLHSRRVVGHATADHLKASLVLDAMDMALHRRAPAAGSWRGQQLLVHSDRGVQYACDACRTLLAAHGIDRSMSRVGNCYDNAVAESFFATIKRELIHRHRFATRGVAAGAIFEWIEVFYNRIRRHSTLGYLSPADFEAAAA